MTLKKHRNVTMESKKETISNAVLSSSLPRNNCVRFWILASVMESTALWHLVFIDSVLLVRHRKHRRLRDLIHFLTDFCSLFSSKDIQRRHKCKVQNSPVWIANRLRIRMVPLFSIVGDWLRVRTSKYHADGPLKYCAVSCDCWPWHHVCLF